MSTEKYKKLYNEILKIKISHNTKDRYLTKVWSDLELVDSSLAGVISTLKNKGSINIYFLDNIKDTLKNSSKNCGLSKDKVKDYYFELIKKYESIITELEAESNQSKNRKKFFGLF
jgi:hypothetical protein